MRTDKLTVSVEGSRMSITHMVTIHQQLIKAPEYINIEHSFSIVVPFANDDKKNI